MELDAEDLELLGYGAETLLYEMAAEASRVQQATAAAQHERNVENYHFRHKRTNLVRVKAWRAESPEKYREIERRYRQSEKGKAVRAAVNRRYAQTHKRDPAKLAEYNKRYRAKKGAEREQARRLRDGADGRVPGQ